MFTAAVLPALLTEILLFMLTHTVNVIYFYALHHYVNDLSLVHSQKGLSLHLNAHKPNYCVVNGTSEANSLSGDKQHVLCTSEDKGGPGQRAGIRGISSQQAIPYTWLKTMNWLVNALQYDMHSPVTLDRQAHVHILRERAWKLCPQYNE